MVQRKVPEMQMSDNLLLTSSSLLIPSELGLTLVHEISCSSQNTFNSSCYSSAGSPWPQKNGIYYIIEIVPLTAIPGLCNIPQQ